MGDAWTIVKTQITGICGSDVKQVFLEANIDNPLKSVVSFPHVLGHEVVGTVIETGRAVTRVKKGDRVAVYPWLTCVVRGLPPCDPCLRGDFTLCENITKGDFAPGMHSGTCRDVSGGFADTLPAHETMCVPIPDEVSWDAAVLADPFSVMLRAILKAPPERGETVLVYGCGVLGLAGIHLVSKLFPEAIVYGVDTNDRTKDAAMSMGAHGFFAGMGAKLIETVAAHVGASLHRPAMALPWAIKGVDRVYDTVGAAGTLETAIRLLRARGTIVVVGVAPPERFEWTPLYFKEITLTGSSGCGLETFEGQRKNGFQHYLELTAAARISGTEIITHRFPLAAYQEAFVTAHEKRTTRSIKVLFDFA